MSSNGILVKVADWVADLERTKQAGFWKIKFAFCQLFFRVSSKIELKKTLHIFTHIFPSHPQVMQTLNHSLAFLNHGKEIPNDIMTNFGG